MKLDRNEVLADLYEEFGIKTGGMNDEGEIDHCIEEKLMTDLHYYPTDIANRYFVSRVADILPCMQMVQTEETVAIKSTQVFAQVFWEGEIKLKDGTYLDFTELAITSDAYLDLHHSEVATIGQRLWVLIEPMEIEDTSNDVTMHSFSETITESMDNDGLCQDDLVANTVRNGCISMTRTVVQVDQDGEITPIFDDLDRQRIIEDLVFSSFADKLNNRFNSGRIDFSMSNWSGMIEYREAALPDYTASDGTTKLSGSLGEELPSE